MNNDVDLDLLDRLRAAAASERRIAMGIWATLQPASAHTARCAAVVGARQRDLQLAPRGESPPPGMDPNDWMSLSNEQARARQAARQAHIRALRSQGVSEHQMADAMRAFDVQHRPTLADYQAQLVAAQAALARAEREEAEIMTDHAKHAAIAGDLAATVQEAETWLAQHPPAPDGAQLEAEAA